MAKPIRMLLVEDDEAFAELVRATLALAAPEMRIEHANRLSAALTSLGGQPFAVIVTDLNLPDSDGVDTVTHLREAAPRVPIVVLSSNADVEIALEATRRGADHVLGKGEISPEGPGLAHLLRGVASLSGRTCSL